MHRTYLTKHQLVTPALGIERQIVVYLRECLCDEAESSSDGISVSYPWIRQYVGIRCSDKNDRGIFNGAHLSVKEFNIAK